MTHLPFLASDHALLYIQLSPIIGANARRRLFRFEAVWLSHAGFKDLVLTSWNRNMGTRETMNNLRKVLRT